MMRPLFFSLILIATFISGCSDNEPQVYDVPKEGIVKSMPNPPKVDMVSQSLNPESLSTEINPSWVKPEDWIEKPASSVRRGSFSFGQNEEVDISITTFPGDVGGTLANVNRWRSQIQLPSISEESLSETIEVKKWNYVEGLKVVLLGKEYSTHAAILKIEGNSWFIKMTGPSSQVQSQSENFERLMNSIQF